MRALRVAFQRRQGPEHGWQLVDILEARQAVKVAPNPNTLDFDLAETPIHRIREQLIGACVVDIGSGGLGGESVAKRVHPRTRFAFLTAWAAALCAVALVRRYLPL
jgi:hypothetical protein